MARSKRITSSDGTEKSSLRHTTKMKYEVTSSIGVDSSSRMCSRPVSYAMVLRQANGRANPLDILRVTAPVPGTPEVAAAISGLLTVTS